MIGIMSYLPPACEQLSTEGLEALEEQIRRSLSNDMDANRKQQVAQFAVENIDRYTIHETLLDAGATIRDTHAPLGAFTHPAFDGTHVTISHRQSLLEYRAKKSIEAGELAVGLVAASMFDFVGRNEMLADVTEKAVEEGKPELGRLAVTAMYQYGEDFEDRDRDRAEEALSGVDQS